MPKGKFTCQLCQDRAAAELDQKRARDRAEAVRHFLAWLPEAPFWPWEWPERVPWRDKERELVPHIVLPLDQAAETFADAAVPGRRRAPFSFRHDALGRTRLPEGYEDCCASTKAIRKSVVDYYHLSGSVYQLPGNRILVHWGGATPESSGRRD